MFLSTPILHNTEFGTKYAQETRTMTLKFVPLPEVNGIFEWGTGSVVRVFIHFSVLLGDFWVLVAGL